MGTSKITETSRVTNGNWLTLVAPCTCSGCRRCSGSCQNLTDVPDGLCASCRAWRTCDDLVEGVRNTLEKFFDARYQPHDGTGNYYSDEPAPEFDLAYDQILGAIDETGAGIKKLIELALLLDALAGGPVQLLLTDPFGAPVGFRRRPWA